MKNKENELISIVVPVYNVQDYLNKCYESIRNQTYSNLEIIFVDDGATDKSGEMCDEFAKDDNRVKVFHTENRGLSAARNLGVKQCGGQYVMFVDSDDYISPWCVECLYAIIKKDSTKYAIGGVKKVGIEFSDEFEKPNYEDHVVIDAREAILKLMYRKGINTYAYAKLYERELLRNIQFIVGKVCEDVPFTYEILNKVDKVSCIDTVIYHYVQRAESILHSQFSYKNKDVLEFSKEIMESVSDDVQMRRATASKYFFVLMDVLIRVDDEHIPVKKEIVREIKSVRKTVLLDANNKLSQRFMACITYLPTSFYISIAKLYKKFENKKYK